MPFLAYAIASNNLLSFQHALACGADANTVLPSMRQGFSGDASSKALRSYVDEDRNLTSQCLPRGLDRTTTCALCSMLVPTEID